MATVVRVEGSAYRRPGAKLLIEEDGATLGSLSGGCLEGDVREIGLEVLRTGVPQLRRYDTGREDGEIWGLGLGCAGTIDVFVQPIGLPVAGLIAEVCERLAGEERFALWTVVSGSGAGSTLILPAEEAAAGATAEAFTDIFTPPPHLILCGAGDDALAVCRYASDAGFRVTVVDHRGGVLSRERFPGAARLLEARPEEATSLGIRPGAYAVVKTHSFAHDRDWARVLLEAGACYVGLLGPRARTQEILRQIGAEGSGRVFGPVGLDLGAEGAEQVALSIVAELLAVRASREPAHLRRKEAAIHAG